MTLEPKRIADLHEVLEKVSEFMYEISKDKNDHQWMEENGDLELLERVKGWIRVCEDK